MERSERDELISTYEAGFAAVMAALDGASAAELAAREAPGEWSPIEIVHHLGDSEMAAAIRLRRLIAEDRPEINVYDQDEYVRRLHSDRPIEPSLSAFKGARESTAQLLRCLSEEEWLREGTHTEAGRFTVHDWLRAYGVHAHGHADQIRRARAAAS